MTVEEIKQTYSMRDIAEQHGVRVKRDGMCCCPFHGEKNPSMKIYKDSFNCFACGKNGDIFTFIQLIDNCDFKTAFYSLGGTYEKPTTSSRLAIYRAQKGKEKRVIKEQKKNKMLSDILADIKFYRFMVQNAEPQSEDWWKWFDKFHWSLILAENAEGRCEK